MVNYSPGDFFIGLPGIMQMQMGFDNNLYYVNIGDLNNTKNGFDRTVGDCVG